MLRLRVKRKRALCVYNIRGSHVASRNRRMDGTTFLYIYIHISVEYFIILYELTN